MKSEVTELLGIKYPIIQGGMAWVAEHNLAAAVSNAGGFGIIGAANAPAEWVRDEIRKAKELTDKPFGVNVMLLSQHADEVAQAVAEEGVKAVTTGAGSPEKYMKMWKEAGCGKHSSYRSRRHRRWQRICSGKDAWSRCRSDGDTFYRFKRIHCSRSL